MKSAYHRQITYLIESPTQSGFRLQTFESEGRHTHILLRCVRLSAFNNRPDELTGYVPRRISNSTLKPPRSVRLASI
jgi:hypothetical protein